MCLGWPSCVGEFGWLFSGSIALLTDQQHNPMPPPLWIPAFAGMTMVHVKPRCSAGLTAVQVKPRCSAGLTAVQVKPRCSAGMTVMQEKPHCSAGMTVVQGKPRCSAGMTIVGSAPYCSEGMWEHLASAMRGCRWTGARGGRGVSCAGRSRHGRRGYLLRRGQCVA